MAFNPDQILSLPELAEHLGLASHEFRVDHILRGGMGECICVVQGEQSFALKVIQRDIVEDADSWSRYLRELRLWTTLSACDGVVEAFCIIRLNELPVVCSRWMRGGSLRRHLRNRSPEFFFAVVSRVVGTLAWAHEQHSVIHRDLKPDNILLDETGTAFVSDWGLARPLTTHAPEAKRRPSRVCHGSELPALTAAGTFLGTVYYASPEQLLGDVLIDLRADLYSLGCLMYEWEAGRCPFTGTSAEEIQLKHLFELPAPLESAAKKTAFGVEDVVRRCLEKDPAERFPDYSSLDHALAQAADRRGIQYQRFRPKLRYEMPMVGAGNHREHVRSRNVGVSNDEGTYALVEGSDVDRLLREANALSAVGDYAKAADIYGSLFVPQAVAAAPDYSYNQFVAIGYALCLTALGRAKEAVEVLELLSAAEEKPAAYFVNLSLALIKRGDHSAAARIASEGLGQYPDDQDLVGNLLIAQTALEAFTDAAETAQVRLAHLRDVHSLQEVAALHCKHAERTREIDWPLAVKNLRYAVGLLREAKEMNPRYLPVRIQLPMALEQLTAYSQCRTEIISARDLPWHSSDRAFLAHLFARCLDRVNDHKGCWQFCDDWLKKIDANQGPNPVPRHNVVRMERVRAVTIVDGFCIGMMKDGRRVIVPAAAEFFAHIVRDVELREPGDFCYLARLHEWMQEYDEAGAILDQAQALYPKYWEIPFQRAAFRVRADDHAGARDAAERAAELGPWKTQTWELLGEVYGKLGRAAQADEAHRRAAEVQRVRDRLSQEIRSI